MKIIDDAKLLVGRYHLSPGESIGQVRLSPGGAEVDTEKWTWRVQPVSIGNGASFFIVYDVTRDFMSEPDQQPEGFAVLSDGTVYELSARTGLSEFWQLAEPPLRPFDLATLLTRYHASGPSAHVIKTENDLDHEVGSVVARAVDGLIAPREQIDESGAFAALDFCSWLVSGDNTISVNRWHLEISESGLIWDVVTIGSKLPWHVDH